MRSPRVGPWGPNVRGGGAVARESPGVVVETVSCGVMDAGPPFRRPRAGGVRPHSLWWARQASGMCGGAGTVICGEPRVAAECRCTEREFGWCARPTVRPGRTVHDDRDHGDGSDTRPRGRRTNGSLTETPVRDWPYWRERFDGSADRHMNPGPLDGTDPGPGTSSPRASSQTDRSTPMAIRPWSSMRRATRPSCPVVRRRGRGTRPPGRSCDGRDAAGARGPLSHDPDVVLAGQRSRGQGWDRVIGAVSSHLRAARASLLRNAPSRSRHRRRLVGRAAGLSSSVGAWQTWPMKSDPPSYHGYRFPPRS